MSAKPKVPMGGKTQPDAEKFADSLTDKTEAEMFLKWFAEGDEEKVRGHFPAFYDDKKGGN